jgi:hypothetical protein
VGRNPRWIIIPWQDQGWFALATQPVQQPRIGHLIDAGFVWR